MAKGDRDDEQENLGPERTDPDRAAILARRQRFVAMALSGLTTALTSCDRNQPGPLPCLEPKPPESGTPEPCLEVAAPHDEGGDDGGDEGDPPPMTSGGEDGAGEDDGGPVKPEACLKVVRPPQPQPCLDVAPPPEEVPDPTPRPCLKVKSPE